MTNLQHILQRARRRRLVATMLQRAGLGLTAAAVVAMALLLVDRLLNVPAQWWMYPALCGAGLLAGAAAALLVRTDRLTLAVQLDHALRLKDRLGSATALELGLVAKGRDGQDAFAELIRRDAERAASGADVRRAVPVRMPKIWNTALLLAVALALGVVFLPEVTWGDQAGRDTLSPLAMKQLEQQREQLSGSIDSVINELNEAGEATPVGEQLEALQQLRQQLEQPAQPDEVDRAQDEAAARFNELADELNEQAEREQQALEELARRFEWLEPADAPPTTREMLEELRKGDYDGAADRLERLLEQAEQMDAQQRRQAADSLRSASRQAQQDDDAASNRRAARMEQLEQALRDRGLDQQDIEEINQNAANQSERELTDELIERGVDEPVARKAAEQLKELDRQRDIEQRRQRHAEQLNDALQRAADELEHKQQPPTDDAPTMPEPQQQPPHDESSGRDDVTPPSEGPQEQHETQQAPPPAPQQDRPQQEQQSKPDQQREQKPTVQQRKEKTPAPSEQSGRQQDEQPGDAQQQQQQEQTKEPGAAPKQQQRQGTSQDPDASQQQQQRAAEKQPSAQERGEEPSPGATPQPGGDRNDAPQDAGQPDAQPSPDGQPTPAQQRPGSEDQPGARQPGASDDPSATSQPVQRPGDRNPRDQQQTTGKTPQQKPEGQPAPNQQATDQPRQPGATPAPGEPSAGEDPQLPEDPSEVIRELQKRKDAAERMRNVSEQTRERARRMAERMTPEQRQRWAREFHRQFGDEFDDEGDSQPDEQRDRPADARRDDQRRGATGDRTEPGDQPGARSTDPDAGPMQYEDVDALDARGAEGQPDHLISEWLSEQDIQGEPGTATREAAAPEPVRRAQDFARRAVNESAVPRRYHSLIERYFGKLPDIVHENSAGRSGDSRDAAPTPGSGADDS